MDRRSFQAHLDHLVAMWKKAAFREHAEFRAREMAAESKDLYGRMPEALREITDRLKIEASARRALSAMSSPESRSEKGEPAPAEAQVDTSACTPPKRPSPTRT